jgi:hypothetical protein
MAVVLAHELIHVDHNLQGNVDKTKIQNPDDLPVALNEELRTVGLDHVNSRNNYLLEGDRYKDITENMIRAEQGRGPRLEY